MSIGEKFLDPMSKVLFPSISKTSTGKTTNKEQDARINKIAVSILIGVTTLGAAHLVVGAIQLGRKLAKHISKNNTKTPEQQMKKAEAEFTKFEKTKSKSALKKAADLGHSQAKVEQANQLLAKDNPDNKELKKAFQFYKDGILNNKNYLQTHSNAKETSDKLGKLNQFASFFSNGFTPQERQEIKQMYEDATYRSKLNDVEQDISMNQMGFVKDITKPIHQALIWIENNEKNSKFSEKLNVLHNAATGALLEDIKSTKTDTTSYTQVLTIAKYHLDLAAQGNDLTPEDKAAHLNNAIELFEKAINSPASNSDHNQSRNKGLSHSNLATAYFLRYDQTKDKADLAKAKDTNEKATKFGSHDQELREAIQTEVNSIRGHSN